MPNLPTYLDPKKPIQARIKDLLKRMTIEEKAGQLISPCPTYQVRPENYSDEALIVEAKRLIDMGTGQLADAIRHATPENAPRIANILQRYALEKTRLGIPLLIQEEALHGCKAFGSTMFPMSIGLAATWNDSLMEKIVHVIGKETRTRGINQVFSPTLDVARDARCGRVEETYGEDPQLLSRMARVFVKTIQSYGIAATPKHFVANFAGDGGRDSHPMHFSERLLREVYFPGYKAVVEEAGALSLMIAHSALDGIPCSSNSWLLQDILRKEWGFKGFVISDNNDVQKVFTMHSQAESFEQATKLCIEAGMDSDLGLPPPEPLLPYLNLIPKLVKEGKLKQKFVDECVARVLYVKFTLGLFENPYVDETVAPQLAQCPEHRHLALEAALESVCLLKNDGVLPLPRKPAKIAVMGPSAKKPRMGGYSCDGANAVSPHDGIKARAPKGTDILYAEGCKLADPDRSGFAEALKIARKADVVLMFMGNSSDWDPDHDEEITEGEHHDRCNLDLPGEQENLILEVAKVNPNVVVILQNGSAITMKRWLGSVRAVLEVWYAGMECGNAIARVVFGEYNPAGRLPITFPTTTGMCPLYYNPRPHGRVADYCDHRGPLAQFAFGYGLSYTKFDYSVLRITKSGQGKALKVKVTCTVKNMGGVDGDEVVQVYLRDIYSSVTRPIIELKRFKRIHVKAGTAEKVSFTLDWEDFSFLDKNLKPVVEPGDFNILVGASSTDIRLQKKIRL